MFFGLMNSPATFQTMMDEIFRVEINNGQVIVYIDDVLIFSKTLREHHAQVRRVMQIFRNNKLYLNLNKCTFDEQETEYLGVIVGHGQVRMDPVKVAGIADWRTPTDKRQVQSFLGFCNFYRHFIQGYSGIARPLTRLTGNDPWVWGPEQEEAFEWIKTLITTAPVLVIPTNDDLFRIEADTSEFAIGAVLSQRQHDVWKLVAYLSKALTPTQRNYEVYDRKMLAIMVALSEWHHYLMGAAHPFEIWTDHQNLTYFKQPQKLNRQQARWLSELANYHFTLHYVPGKQNTKANALSRHHDLDTGESDNENEILLKSEFICSLDLQSKSIEFETLIRRHSRNREERVERALRNKEEGWKELESGLITFRERIYVPIHAKLREDIIRENHDSTFAGHPGRYKTAELITHNYWWPQVQHDVREYVDECKTCQRVKTHRTLPAAPLHPHEAPSRPWEIITLDLLGPLPMSNGYNAILVIID
jgi:hypothetical protein